MNNPYFNPTFYDAVVRLFTALYRVEFEISSQRHLHTEKLRGILSEILSHFQYPNAILRLIRDLSGDKGFMTAVHRLVPWYVF